MPWLVEAHGPTEPDRLQVRGGSNSERLEEADGILDPVREAVETVRRHVAPFIHRWTSGYSDARLEALNSLFQAARARARG